VSKTRNISDLLDANGDVKSSALDNVPASDVVNDTSPQLGGDLASNGNDILMADSDKIKLGTGTDLEFYHDGNDSYIQNDTGGLFILGNNAVQIKDESNSKFIAKFVEDGACELYHNNSKKIETTSGGVTITGTATATAFSGDGSGLTGVAGVPSGVIAMWSGASNAIPSGWYICDGNNGTPNLTDKFIKASGTAGTTGGSTTSGATTLSTSQIPSHNHNIEGTNGSSPSNKQRNYTIDTNYNAAENMSTDNTGGGGSHTHSVEPPYYTLIFIMKS